MKAEAAAQQKAGALKVRSIVLSHNQRRSRPDLTLLTLQRLEETHEKTKHSLQTLSKENERLKVRSEVQISATADS